MLLGENPGHGPNLERDTEIDTQTHTHTQIISTQQAPHRNKFTDPYFSSTSKSKICHGFRTDNH